MATKKDLVEAHAFSRRRLVTAFVSGAPGGREVEPTRPGRTVVGGLALAVLLVAGAAIASQLSPRPPSDWTEGGLVVSKEKGAAYVILEGGPEPVLRPVINVTSAQLILGADPDPSVVDQSEIDKYTIGEDIGILNAPATVPDADLLLRSGWTACTGRGLGLKVDVSAEPQVVPAEPAGLLVRSGDRTYVVAQAAAPEVGDEPRAHAYELPRSASNDLLLQAVGLPIRKLATPVPAQWLTLFPAGGALDFESLGIDGYGRRSDLAGTDGLPADARIGDYYRVGDITLVLTPEGPVELTDFALAVYLNSELPRDREPRELFPSSQPQISQQVPGYAAASWPAGTLDPVVGEHCAVLLPRPGEAPVVRIATDPGADASAEAAGLAPDEVDRTVDPGRGAYALAAGWDEREVGSPYFVDAKGAAYALVGPEVAERLGFGSVDPPLVPDSWVQLFDDGVPLSVDAALCPPVRDVTGSRCD